MKFVSVAPTSFVVDVVVCQVDASWIQEFKFETTATGQLLLSDAAALPVAVRAAVALGRGMTVSTDGECKNFRVRTARGGSQELLSALVFTKSLRILGSPLGVRVSVVGKSGDAAAAADGVEQAEVWTSPLRVRNEGIDLVLDVLLNDDNADADVLEEQQQRQRLRVSVVRPQLVHDDVEISRIEIAAGWCVGTNNRC